jgi:hypothetical protein
MTYKILSSRTSDITLFTMVEFNFDGDIVSIEVAHFMPKTEQEIEQNILNVASAEVAKKQAMLDIQNLVPILPINEEKPI